jgi:Xaa-Pro aminopeptidase
MGAGNIDAALITEPHNIFYLCGSNGGYTGARICLIVDAGTSVLVIDKRYLAEAEENAVADKMVAWTEAGYKHLAEVVQELDATAISFESGHVTVRQHERLKKDFDKIEGIELIGISGLVEPIREVKDEYELQKIAEAARIGDRAFDHILEYIKPGVTEMAVAIELDFFMRRIGAERSSFETIVASGVHSAVPHATPTHKKIEPGDFVKLDFGAVVDGYHSDMSRTVVVGKASERQKEVYAKVLEAQVVALNMVSPGMACKDIDAVARNIISQAGFGENFVHGLGHGVGLEVHEIPTLAPNSEMVLKNNMVTTIEPGIYINGFGGVRVEDLVIVSEIGCKILSHSTKDLLEL